VISLFVCWVDYGKQVLHPAADSININRDIWSMYYNDLLPKIVAPGDDGNYGSASVCDVLCLQVFHYIQILLVYYSGYVHHKRM
jgi:hypothetical protein